MRQNPITLEDDTVWAEGTKVFTFHFKGAKIIITSHVPQIYQDARPMKLLDCFETKEKCLKRAEKMAAWKWSSRISNLKQQLKLYEDAYNNLSQEAKEPWITNTSN